MDEKKRLRVSFFGTIIFHVVVFLFVGLTGLLHFTSLDKSDIFEVVAVSGGGGGNSGGGAINEAVKEVKNSEQAALTPEELGADAILEHSDTSKTTVSYQQLEKLQKEEKQKENTEEDKPKEEKSTTVPSHVTTPSITNTQGNNSGESNNNSSNTGNGEGAGTGQSSGSGSGEGSGDGTGSGSGSGSGSGTGAGSGDGNGIGAGTADETVYSNPAVPPSVLRRASPNYPSRERENKIEGTTTIRFLIGKDGSIESVEVVASSGNSALDNAAVNAGYRWRFSPAKNGAGQPVRCYASVPITFRIR